MQMQADITFERNRLFITGCLGFANVMSVYNKSIMHLESHPEVTFDFSRLKSSNSAGLALILELIKFAKKQRKKIHFEHLSGELMSIAKAAGIDKMITDLEST